jgi:TRAP-type C4-dicarboxylate transport system permease small subunit
VSDRGGHDAVVLQRDRHLKWRALDILERALMAACGLCLLGFTLAELGDVAGRMLHHPLASAQEFSTGFFIWGVFLGGAVAVRRDTNFRISAISDAWTGTPRLVAELFRRAVMLAVAGVLIVYGYVNYLHGFGSYLTPSGTPIAVLYLAIPVSGVLIALFVIEQIVCGLRNGFVASGLTEVERAIAASAAADQVRP